MAKSNVNESDARLDRIIAAVKAANVPDYVISGMMGRMPKGVWQTAQGGEKPARELFCIAGLFTKNVAGAEGAWHAMMLRKGGASLSEVAYGFSCAAAHNHNYIGLAQGTDKRPGPCYFFRSTLGPSRWSMAFTAKGEKAIMAKLAALSAATTFAATVKPTKAAKPVTGKAKVKKAPKVAPTQTPTVEAPTAELTAVENVTPIEQPVETVDTASTADLTALAEHFNS